MDLQTGHCTGLIVIVAFRVGADPMIVLLGSRVGGPASTCVRLSIALFVLLDGQSPPNSSIYASFCFSAASMASATWIGVSPKVSTSTASGAWVSGESSRVRSR